MLGISIDNEFLDLLPGAMLEMEQENPFLQFSNDMLGEYSLPIEVQATPKNMRLLGYPGTMEVRISNAGIDAVVYNNGIPELRGKIKIEKPTIDMNNMANGRISLYFLAGASSFWQDIKDARMRSIDLGGTRTFDWDGYTFSGTGFWNHVDLVMHATPGYGTSGYDYAFFPVKNTNWGGTAYDSDLMNRTEHIGGGIFHASTNITNSFVRANRLCPFPYLIYIMQKACEHVGWTITGDIFEDEDFLKVVMLSYREIDWAYEKKVSGDWEVIPKDTIEFDLADHLPDITISKFLIALKNRFGWRYEFDRLSKVIRIKELVDLGTIAAKDYTSKSNPRVAKQISQQTKVYALKNSFANELGAGAPDFSALTLVGGVDELTDLPAAAEALLHQVYLVRAENNYYICRQNEAEAYYWELYTWNIYDYEPEGSNEEITTEATTVGVEAYDAYLDLIPRADNAGAANRPNEDGTWGIDLCFNHGVKNNKAAEPYPYGSSHIYDSNFNQVAEWALTFECETAGGAADVGLYQRAWSRLLALLSSNEEADLILYLSRTEQMQLTFEDTLNIRNTRHFIKTMKPTIPYTSKIELRVVRI
jgi:hypothetical protein